MDSKELSEKVAAIAEKLVDIAENPQHVYSAGVEAGKAQSGSDDYYDKFWDEFQRWDENTQTATRTTYNHAFIDWGAEYIRPKYKVEPTTGSCVQIFHNNRKLKIIEKEYFDFSNVPVPSYATVGNHYTFQFCSELEVIEDIGLPGYYYNGTFHSCEKLHTIEMLRSNENTTYNADPFRLCSSLINVTFSDDSIIGNDINFQWSPLLSTQSIVNIMTTLSETASGKTIILSQTAVDNMVFPYTYKDVTYDTWDDLIATKANWAISLL